MTSDNSQNRSILQDVAHWADVRPDAPWLIEEWTSHRRAFSWKQSYDEIQAIAAWLEQQPGAQGRKIGLLAPNSAHWMLADLAIISSGGVTVPIFTSMDADTVAYVADFSELDILFLGKAANWEAVQGSFHPGMKIIRLPDAPEVAGAQSWDELLELGRAADAPSLRDPESLATIVFTSGTTGKPKGVMHTMTSLREAAVGIVDLATSKTGDRFISYLPLPHLAERVLVEMHSIYVGGSVYFSEGLETFLKDLRTARPNFMLGVPRIWEKLQQGVVANLVSHEELQAAKDENRVPALGEKVRDFLGLSDVRYVMTATAPTAVPLKAWYEDLNIVLYDAYGQSEILPISGNKDGDHKIDSVGKPSPGVEVMIAPDGEILARGGGTAIGYYKAPEKTRETFAEGGWVHTGDKGLVDEDGHVFITGRVKEIFKTAKGKYVAPAPIEGQFLESPLIEQACLTGHGLTQTVMIAVVSEAAADTDKDTLIENLSTWSTAINSTLPTHERMGALILSRAAWTQENGVLTHTLKLRRDAVEDQFAPSLEKAGERMRAGEAFFVLFDA